MHFTRINCGCTRRFNKMMARNHYCTKYVNQAIGGAENFEKDFKRSHIETNSFQKFLLGVGSGIVSLTDPKRGDMVAVMGESTGTFAFQYIRSKMMESEEGKKILEDKPRISSKSVNLEHLKEFPDGTLGKAYSNFLERYKYSPDSRLAVRFIDDFELAYVAQRYREAHDLFHTILDMPTNMLGEVTVKWVEAIQTRLPMCVTGALFGALRLAPKLTRMYSSSAKASIDPDVLRDIERELYKPRKHAGVMKTQPIEIPEKLRTRIYQLLQTSDISIDSNKLKYLRKVYYTKELELEGMAYNLRRQNLINAQLSKLVNKKKGNHTAEDMLDIASQKADSYLKALKKKRKLEPLKRTECLSYLAVRAPYEYDTVSRIFREISRRDPEFQPQTLFDFGSGVGTVTWAASTLWKKTLNEYYTVDVSEEMNDLAYEIIHPQKNASPLVNGIIQRQFFPSGDNQYDIVVSAFTLLNLGSYESRMQAVHKLWDKTYTYLVLVENGTKAGFQVIKEAREMILNDLKSLNYRSHVFAPCPHDSSCPRAGSDPCNFLSVYSEKISRIHGDFAKTPYSYVVIKKEPRPKSGKQWPRVVKEVKHLKRCIVCSLCTAEGDLKEIPFSKSKVDKEMYRCVRALHWGDLFPGIVTSNTEINDSDLNIVNSENDETSKK